MHTFYSKKESTLNETIRWRVDSLGFFVSNVHSLLGGFSVKIESTNKTETEKAYKKLYENELHESGVRFKVNYNGDNSDIELLLSCEYDINLSDTIKDLKLPKELSSLIPPDVYQEIQRWCVDLGEYVFSGEEVQNEWLQVRQQLKEVVDTVSPKPMDNSYADKIKNLVKKTIPLIEKAKKIKRAFSPDGKFYLDGTLNLLELEKYLEEFAALCRACDIHKGQCAFKGVIDSLKAHSLDSYQKRLQHIMDISKEKYPGDLSYGYHAQLLLNILNDCLSVNPRVGSEVFDEFFAEAFQSDQLNQSYLSSIEKHLVQLRKVNALDSEVLTAIIQGKVFDKSSQARLTGTMNFGYTNEEKEQILWGYCCVAAENKMGSMLSSGKNLKEIFHVLRQFRHDIAKKISEVRSAEDFGKIRHSVAIDYYSSSGVSAANHAIFPDVKEIFELSLERGDINQQLKKNSDDLLKQLDRYPAKLTARYINPQPQNSLCDLPDELILVSSDGDALCAIFDQVLSEDKVNEGLEKLHEKLLLPLVRLSKDEPFDQERFLEKLGELTFYLARLYPLRRGTGALCQWIVRGITKTLVGVELGDINLGQKCNIPCDIYSQFVHSPKEYAKAFSEAITETCSEQREMKSIRCLR